MVRRNGSLGRDAFPNQPYKGIYEYKLSMRTDIIYKAVKKLRLYLTRALSRTFELISALHFEHGELPLLNLQ